MKTNKTHERDRDLSSRRDFLKKAGMGMISLAGMLNVFPVLTKEMTIRKKPNIIYILADDLGYGHLGCYGQEIIKTPCLDRMCQEGIKFTEHYAGAPLCGPSRQSLLSGNFATVERHRGIYTETSKMIPRLLKEVGYKTACIGKWGDGKKGIRSANGQGFDYFFGHPGYDRTHCHYTDVLWRNSEEVILKDNPLKKDQYIDDLFTKEALDFIRTNKENPFFLYLPYCLPHSEYLVPQDSLEQYLGKIEEKPLTAKAKELLKEPYNAINGNPSPYPRAAQAGMISRLDSYIAKILDLLKELDLDENTIVFFSSDNGPCSSGDYPFFKAAGPLNGRKFTLYEGGIRVPCIVRWPGKIKHGSVTNHISALCDVLPTITEIAGAKPPDDIDGISMLPTLLGERTKQKEHAYLFWAYGNTKEKKFSYAVRKDKWKAVRFFCENASVGFPPDKPTPIMLFDLEADIGEKHDLASQHPEIVAEMEHIMKKNSAGFF